MLNISAHFQGEENKNLRCEVVSPDEFISIGFSKTTHDSLVVFKPACFLLILIF